MILEEATKEAFGYYASELTYGSNKCIIAVCDSCGEIRSLKKCTYHVLCQTCAQKGEKSSSWKPKVNCTCIECGKEFEVLLSAIKSSGGKYCSHSCSAKARTGDKSPNYGNHLSEEVKRKISNAEKGKIISAETRAKHSITIKGTNHWNWQGGISFEPYCVKFNKEFKNYIRLKFDNRCFLCGKPAEENGRKLGVHHINYNKNCGCDGDKTCNFVPLCMRCHTKTNFNRDYWQKLITDKLHCMIIGWDV